ncbi:MAG: DUF1826 domain-containing protein [Pseudomonadota bacterium]
MQALKVESSISWHFDTSPLALGEIVSPQISIAGWKRDVNSAIQQYFDSVFHSLGLGIRGVFSIDDMISELTKSLPDGQGKNETVKDIFLLSDMLTCLFDCRSVGLRLVPLTSAMCPKFHTDNIPVRLLTSYLGQGTQWLPIESLYEYPPKALEGKLSKTNFDMFYQQKSVRQLQAFDVALLKGSAWPDHEKNAAVHRSCRVGLDEKRVLLTLDPM